ncbi:MAG: NADPH-dependent F420 reductase [Conexivisphaerales archaeon]
MVARIAVIGTGNVGKAIAEGLKRKYEVRFGSRNHAKVNRINGIEVTSPERAVRWGEVVFLAVPYGAVKDTIASIGEANFKGKVVVDVTNPLTEQLDLAIGYKTSAAEELAKLIPEAKIVKAFNYVFAANMPSSEVKGEKLTLFVAGDDSDAKSVVMRMGSDIGFDPVDSGPLSYSRYLEPMAIFIVRLAYRHGFGTNIGFRLVH